MFSNYPFRYNCTYMTVRKWHQVFRYEYEHTAEYMQIDARMQQEPKLAS